MSSANTKSRMRNFMQESEIIQHLTALFEDDSYRTAPGYSIDAEKYPEHEVPFVEDHRNYLKRHPQVDPAHYLSNLRLMLKIR